MTFVSIDARTASLSSDADADADGPGTASVALDRFAELELGVWEIAPGTVTDTEVDELFVVVAGSATLSGVGQEPIELCPGVIVRLRAGMRTTWVVHETLRKVYLA